MSEKNQECLPCPFCGAVPTLTHDNIMDTWTVECPTSDKACVQPMACGYDLNAVVARWNNRMLPIRWPTMAEIKSERERTLRDIEEWKTGHRASPGQMANSERYALAMRENIKALDRRLETINELLSPNRSKKV